MFLATGLGDLEFDPAPGSFEGSAYFRKSRGSAARADTWMRRWVEGNGPMPLIDLGRHTGARADRTDLDILGEDQPVLLLVFAAVADERGHRS